MTRRRFLWSLFGGISGVGLYTWQVEPHWLEVTRHLLPVKDLPVALHGKTLLHLSDIHVGPKVYNWYVRQTFRIAQALEPDIVAYTGDFITWYPQVLRQAKELYQDAPHGKLYTVGIAGNHDYGPGWGDTKFGDSLFALLEEAEIPIVRNKVAVFEGLQFVGLDDRWSFNYRPRVPLGLMDPASPALALSHNPDNADDQVWRGFKSTILSGHTHGGQCRPPFLPPPILPVKNHRYTAGWFDLSGERRMYVNRGVGHLMQARFNVRPEIALFTLIPEESTREAV